MAWLLEETVRYGILFWVPLLLDGILSGHFNGKSAVTTFSEYLAHFMPCSERRNLDTPDGTLWI